MTFISNPRRDASATIAGFVFQVNVTILRWLELREDEHLELERGEDIDTVQNGDGSVPVETRLLEQIKVRSGRSLTLRSEEALEALSNFCNHRAANPAWNLKFRYLTTADSGVEQGWVRPDSGIETWMALQRGRYDDTTRCEAVAALRAFSDRKANRGSVDQLWPRGDARRCESGLRTPLRVCLPVAMSARSKASDQKQTYYRTPSAFCDAG